jgi:hypothetical protein
MDIGWQCLRTGCRRDDLELRGRKNERAGKNCTMTGSIICAHHCRMIKTRTRWARHIARDELCLQDFNRDILREVGG